MTYWVVDAEMKKDHKSYKKSNFCGGLGRKSYKKFNFCDEFGSQKLQKI
jgi:hypothetical protein